MTTKLLIGSKLQLLTFFYGVPTKGEEDYLLKRYAISRICIATNSLLLINVDINSIRYCIHFANVLLLIVINKVKSKLKEILSNVKKAKNDVIYNILLLTKLSSPVRLYNSIMSNDFAPIVLEVAKEEQYKNDLKNDIDVYYYDPASNLVLLTHLSNNIDIKAKDAYEEGYMLGSPLVDILNELKAIQKRLSNLLSSKTLQAKPLKTVLV